VTALHRLGIAGIAGLLAVAACGGKSTPTTHSTFNNESGHSISCMTHQAASPGNIDKPGVSDDPASVLAMLRYYTANGNKPYCDRKPATTIDRQWLDLYIAGGSSPTNIRRALSGS
jgi:hypothetical protein